MDACSNFFITPPGKLAVRGGSQVKRTLTSANRTLLIRPFTPTGALALAHADSSTQHYVWRLTADLAFFTGVEATSKHSLWATVNTARPVSAELYERLYLADANTDITLRQSFCSVSSAGAISTPTYDLVGGAAALKPYCIEEYNGVLFAAGYDSNTTPNAPEIIRHSLLATAPDAAGAWDQNAYLYLGAKGQRVTALKKGRGLLLAAKANELHRISGYGRALPGWQYTVEQVSNALGAGVSNPLALTFDGDHWYGLGEAGPFRTDGFKVESLVGARRRSWAKVTKLEFAWAQYHPDRNCVLFGVTMTPTPAGRSATYPNTIWVWDCEREVWVGDITCSADIYFAHAVPTATVQGPSAAPTTLAFTHASSTESSVAATWANGDVSAATEIWVRSGTGGSVLWATAAAGATSATVSGLAAGTRHEVKIRHIKAGVGSDFTAEVSAYTVYSAPSLFREWTESTVNIRAATNSSQGVVEYERAAVLIGTNTITAPGNYDFLHLPLACNTAYSFRIRIFDSSWPAGIQYSAYTTESITTSACGSGATGGGFPS